MVSESRIFPASMESVAPAVAWLGSITKKAGFSGERAGDAATAFVEAFTNVVRHGAGDQDASITVETVERDGGLDVTLVDAGPAFDPTVRRSESREGNEQHGMGLMIIRDIARTLSYEFRDGRNRFTLSFDLR